MDFPDALKLVLELEGGKVDAEGDHGGRTAYGITQNTYDLWNVTHGRPKQDVWGITAEEVDDIYYRRFWLIAECDKLPGRLAVAHFVACVHCGVAPANDFLEDSSWAESAEDCRIFAYLSLYRAFLQRIVIKKPGQAKFLKGWMNRVSKTLAFVKRAQ